MFLWRIEGLSGLGVIFFGGGEFLNGIMGPINWLRRDISGGINVLARLLEMCVCVCMCVLMRVCVNGTKGPRRMSNNTVKQTSESWCKILRRIDFLNFNWFSRGVWIFGGNFISVDIFYWLSLSIYFYIAFFWARGRIVDKRKLRIEKSHQGKASKNGIIPRIADIILYR